MTRKSGDKPNPMAFAIMSLALLIGLLILPITLRIAGGIIEMLVGLGAGLVAVFLVRIGLVNQAVARTRIVSLSIWTIVLAGAAVFGLIPTAVASAQRHFECAGGSGHWTCDIVMPTVH